MLLAVNQQMRWDAGIAASRDLIERGVIGEVFSAELLVSIATPWHLWPWLAEAPRLEVTYHSLHYQDALRSIMGDPLTVTSVHGRHPEQAPVKGETITRTVLEYATGAQALVTVNHFDLHAEPSAAFRFLGTRGALEGTIGLLYDYPHGRPDTLELWRDAHLVRRYDFDTMWIPDAFLGPMADLMDGDRDRPHADHERARQPRDDRGRRGGVSVRRRAPERAARRDHGRDVVTETGATDSPGTPGAIFSLLHRAFGDVAMEAIFSERATVAAWLRTEAELARSQAAIGDLDPARAEVVAAACTVDAIDLPRLWAATANVGYPILPLIRQVHDRLPEDARGVMHFGATTQDIMDTGLALQLSDAHARLEALLQALGDRLAELTERHAATVMAGRTHGQQAVPITFGAKLATYLRQCERLRADLDASRRASCVLSLHGAAGTSAALGSNAPSVRIEMARRLGLELPSGPWHVARDGLALFGGLCGRIAGMCARFAREVADLARTEIGEVAESGGHHRGASSTMPQKENPIDSETVLGMAVTVTTLVGASYRAMEASHERSTGEWQVEWHVVPQVAVLTAGALAISGRIAAGLRVDPERMTRNLGIEQGRILAEAYLFQLAPRLGREAAHDLVYEAATRSKSDGVELHEALVATMRRTGIDDEGLVPLRPEGHTGAARAEALAAVADWRRRGSVA